MTKQRRQTTTRPTTQRTNKPRNPNPPRAINDNYRRPCETAPYTGDGLECITTLSPDTNTPAVLADVAAWHEAPWRRAIRHSIIAEALRSAAEDGRRRAA